MQICPNSRLHAVRWFQLEQTKSSLDGGPFPESPVNQQPVCVLALLFLHFVRVVQREVFGHAREQDGLYRLQPD